MAGVEAGESPPRARDRIVGAADSRWASDAHLLGYAVCVPLTLSFKVLCVDMGCCESGHPAVTDCRVRLWAGLTCTRGVPLAATLRGSSPRSLQEPLCRCDGSEGPVCGRGEPGWGRPGP